MSSYDIEALIGSPMQYPIDMQSGQEYYMESPTSINEDEEDADNEMSENSIEYSEEMEIEEQQNEQYDLMIENINKLKIYENQIVKYIKSWKVVRDKNKACPTVS